MIRFANEKDKSKLKELCISSQSAKQELFLNYYFEHKYIKSNVLVTELDSKLISQVHMNEHVLNLQNKKLLVSYLSGINTHYDYRQRGIIRDLLDLIIEDETCKYLFTFVEACNPKLFEKYGFEILNFRKRYVIYKEELTKVNAFGVTNQVKSSELLMVFQKFSAIFDCYYDRDLNYYSDLIRRVTCCDEQIATYYEGDQLQAYCIYVDKKDEVLISEIIYLDSLSLMKLLKYVLDHYLYVCVEVSESERLERVFKQSIPRTHAHTMVRLNQPKLYNKLFNVDVKNTKQFISSLKKPILLNEKF